MTQPDLAELSGLELLRERTAEDESDRPSIGRLLGMRFDEAEHGRVVMSLQTRPDFANPLGTLHGTLHGGTAATLLDSVVGCAVHTTLPAGVSCTTLELEVDYIRAVQTSDVTLRATGTVIHTGRRVATAEGRVVDDRDRLIAHATTTCSILQR